MTRGQNHSSPSSIGVSRLKTPARYGECMNGKVSVVIPTLNRRPLLARTLSTVLGQTHRDLEVIVVDDGSTDDTLAFLSTVHDPRLVVLSNPAPHGVAPARNRALAECVGSFVAFVDDDDLWAPDKIRAQLAAIEATPGAEWSYVGAVVVDERLRLLRWQRVPPAAGLTRRLLEANVIPGGASGVLASRRAVSECGGFDPRLSTSADWDMWIRLSVIGPAAPVDRALLCYLRHNSMSTQLSGKEEELNLLDEKHAALRQEVGAAPPTLAILHYTADTHLRAGDRRGAREAYRRATALRRNPVSRIRALLTYIPGWIGLYDFSKRLAIPRTHRRETEAWLSLLREAEGRAA